MKKVIITGVTGQDGSHMADYLLANTDIEIIAGVRRLSVKNHENIEHLEENPRFKLIDLDVTDQHNVNRVILQEKPDYFINFAANSFVGTSWKMPVNHMETNCMAVLYQLCAIAEHAPNCRYYNAGSSEEFGDVVTSPQDETHPLRPRSPYGASKAAARHLVKVWRESYNLYAIQGWLFNHEGSRRGLDFVTRKITHTVARIKIAIEKGKKAPILKLGNIEAKRDWSDAEDFMDGVWLMLNQEKPKNYVLGSGEMHTVREFMEEALKCAGIEFKPSGKEEDEKYHTKDGLLIFEVDQKFYRPAEVHELRGDPSLAEKELGWARQTDFQGLVKKMYKSDYAALSK